MRSNNCIIPECYIDSCLIEVLLQATRNNSVNHEKSNGRVAMKMESRNFTDDFCIGIIDEDRKPLSYLKKFEPKIETTFLKLWKHSDRHHYIIQIRPVIEMWILEICKKSGIKLSDFGLPETENGLKKVTKSVAARNDEKMMRLFKQMVAKECEPVVQLKGWITYLKEKNFRADINELKNA